VWCWHPASIIVKVDHIDYQQLLSWCSALELELRLGLKDAAAEYSSLSGDDTELL
jgi:hypothetical protein